MTELWELENECPVAPVTFTQQTTAILHPKGCSCYEMLINKLNAQGTFTIINKRYNKCEFYLPVDELELNEIIDSELDTRVAIGCLGSYVNGNQSKGLFSEITCGTKCDHKDYSIKMYLFRPKVGRTEIDNEGFVTIRSHGEIREKKKQIKEITTASEREIAETNENLIYGSLRREERGSRRSRDSYQSREQYDDEGYRRRERDRKNEKHSDHDVVLVNNRIDPYNEYIKKWSDGNQDAEFGSKLFNGIKSYFSFYKTFDALIANDRYNDMFQKWRQGDDIRYEMSRKYKINATDSVDSYIHRYFCPFMMISPDIMQGWFSINMSLVFDESLLFVLCMIERSIYSVNWLEHLELAKLLFDIRMLFAIHVFNLLFKYDILNDQVNALVEFTLKIRHDIASHVYDSGILSSFESGNLTSYKDKIDMYLFCAKVINKVYEGSKNLINLEDVRKIIYALDELSDPKCLMNYPLSPINCLDNMKSLCHVISTYNKGFNPGTIKMNPIWLCSQSSLQQQAISSVGPKRERIFINAKYGELEFISEYISLYVKRKEATDRDFKFNFTKQVDNWEDIDIDAHVARPLMEPSKSRGETNSKKRNDERNGIKMSLGNLLSGKGDQRIVNLEQKKNGGDAKYKKNDIVAFTKPGKLQSLVISWFKDSFRPIMAMNSNAALLEKYKNSCLEKQMILIYEECRDHEIRANTVLSNIKIHYDALRVLINTTKNRLIKSGRYESENDPSFIQDVEKVYNKKFKVLQTVVKSIIVGENKVDYNIKFSYSKKKVVSIEEIKKDLESKKEIIEICEGKKAEENKVKSVLFGNKSWADVTEEDEMNEAIYGKLEDE